MAGPDDWLPGLARSAGSGLLFDFQDELEGGARAAADLDPGSYERYRDQARNEYDAFADKHPYASGATAIGTGFLPTVAAALVPGAEPLAGVNLARVAGPALRVARPVGEAALRVARPVARRAPAIVKRGAAYLAPHKATIAAAMGDAALSSLGGSREKGWSDLPAMIAQNAAMTVPVLGVGMHAPQLYRAGTRLAHKYLVDPVAHGMAGLAAMASGALGSRQQSEPERKARGGPVIVPKSPPAPPVLY